MSRLQIYRRILIGLTAFSLVLLTGLGIYQVFNSIPDEIRLLAGEDQNVSLKLPATGEIYTEDSQEAAGTQESDIEADKLHLNLRKDTTVFSENTGSYLMECKLFGLFRVKTVAVEVVDKTYITPAGSPIGIYLETEGVLIIGTGTVNGMDGISYEPALNLVHSGDYITAIDGNQIGTKDDLMSYLAECGGDEIVLTVDRNGETVQVRVKPVMTAADEYKLGIWVRDNTQGIGTLTYVDTKNKFGALGHGISDSDTGTLMNVKSGLLYEAQIVSIVKGESGSPGGLEGVIQYDNKYLLGEISGNTNAGIFGSIQNLSDLKINSTPMEICLKQEIEIGAATILCAVDGSVREYDIQITDVNIAVDNVNKGIVLQVTDSDLLDLTGGIVQGMSGSPILQNGKIVGAVTHVFVQDSTKGYGIFIENMLEVE